MSDTPSLADLEYEAWRREAADARLAERRLLICEEYEARDAAILDTPQGRAAQEAHDLASLAFLAVEIEEEVKYVEQHGTLEGFEPSERVLRLNEDEIRCREAVLDILEEAKR